MRAQQATWAGQRMEAEGPPCWPLHSAGQERGRKGKGDSTPKQSDLIEDLAGQVALTSPALVDSTVKLVGGMCDITPGRTHTQSAAEFAHETAKPARHRG